VVTVYKGQMIVRIEQWIRLKDGSLIRLFDIRRGSNGKITFLMADLERSRCVLTSGKTPEEAIPKDIDSNVRTRFIVALSMKDPTERSVKACLGDDHEVEFQKMSETMPFDRVTVTGEKANRRVIQIERWVLWDGVLTRVCLVKREDNREVSCVLSDPELRSDTKSDARLKQALILLQRHTRIRFTRAFNMKDPTKTKLRKCLGDNYEVVFLN